MFDFNYWLTYYRSRSHDDLTIMLNTVTSGVLPSGFSEIQFTALYAAWEEFYYSV